MSTELNPQNWDMERTYLRSQFRRGVITGASRKDLERALVILAHSADQDPWPKETEIFRATVSQLLQVRISEELHWRSMVAAGIAAVISFLALFVSGYQAWDAHRRGVAAGVSGLSRDSSPQPILQAPAQQQSTPKQ